VHWYYRHFENIGKDNKDIIPTQFVNDIGILYTFEKSKNTISLDVKNIANRQVFDNFAIQLPGRSVNLKINLNIF
jgi:outer membrane receptor for Fe3+-dicitrate